MVETAYLHIGTGKAGSSSIQAFLRENRTALTQLGYLVPTAVGRTHRNLFHIWSARHLARYERTVGRLKPYFASTEAFTSAVLDEIKETTPRCMILSHEAFALNATPEEIGNIAAWLARFSRKAVIICYVRRQDLMLMSRLQTKVKNGGNISFDDFYERSISRLDYYRKLRQWADAFGIENIRVVPFEVSQWHDNRLIHDFAYHLGIEDTKSLDLSEQRKNTSIGAAGVEIMQRVNALVPGGHRQTYLLLSKALAQMPQTPPSLPLARARDFMAQFEESNRRLALEFLGRADGILFHEPLTERHPVLGEALTLEAVNQVLRNLGEDSADTIDGGCDMIARRLEKDCAEVDEHGNRR